MFFLAIMAACSTASKRGTDSTRVVGNDVDSVFWSLRVGTSEAGYRQGHHQDEAGGDAVAHVSVCHSPALGPRSRRSPLAR